MQQEPLLANGNGLLDAPFSAWLRVIGRLRPGASVEGMSARLTGLLRQWMQSGANYPASWMPEITRNLPKQVINVIPAGGGVGLMKERYGQQSPDPAGGVRAGTADCLCERREPDARPFSRASVAARPCALPLARLDANW